MATKVTWDMLNPARALEADMQAGTSNDKFTTPLSVQQAIDYYNITRLQWGLVPVNQATSPIKSIIGDETNRRFIGVGNTENVIFYSVDGYTWATSGTVGLTSTSRLVHCPSLGLYLAVGIGAGVDVYSSPTLATWTIGTGPSLTAELNDIAVDDATPKIVAVGDNGTDDFTIIYSSNGTSWTEISPSVLGSGFMRCVVFDTSDSQFLVGGEAGVMGTSADGISWALVTTSSFGASRINRVASNEGVYVAVGAGGKIGRSVDVAATWAQVTSPFGSVELQDVAYSKGLGLWVISAPGGQTAFSLTGESWALVDTLKLGTSIVNSVCAPDFTDRVMFGDATGRMAFSL